MTGWGRVLISTHLLVLTLANGCCRQPHSPASSASSGAAVAIDRQQRLTHRTCIELRPVPSPFGPSRHDYEAAVHATVVAEPTDAEPAILMLRTSQENELAVYVVEREGKHVVVARRARKAVWATAHSKGVYDFASDRWEAVLDEETFAAVVGVWAEFVSRTQVPRAFEGFSSPEYFFSTPIDGTWVTGTVTGPKPGSCLADLADLAEHLVLFAQTQSQHRASVLTRIKHLLSVLQDVR